MHITQESDYAVRIVFCLARAGVRMDARSISAQMCVTLRFSLKILGKLAQSGIVASYKGNRGGYELARPASEITLLQVIVAVEGPLPAVPLRGPRRGRGVQPGCFGLLLIPAGVRPHQRHHQPGTGRRDLPGSAGG